MTDLIPFDYSGRQIRTVQVDGEPLVHHADVCAVLEHTNPSVAIRLVEEEDRRKVDMREIDAGQTALNFPATGNAEAWFITEAGFYDLVFASKAPGAKSFKRWVSHVVLPSLRKNGRYELDVPRSLPEALRAYAAEVEAHQETRAELSIVKPQAEAWTTLADTGADYSVREAAYILNRDPSIDTGQMRLFGLLKDWRLIGQDKRPYSSHAKHVTLRPQTRQHPASGDRIPAAPQVRVTVDGLAYLHKRMGGTAALDLSDLDGAA